MFIKEPALIQLHWNRLSGQEEIEHKYALK
jgi:hypothetical protein